MNRKFKNIKERKNTCPICNRLASNFYKPFCSRRCSYIDLANWFGGKYCVEIENLYNDEDVGGLKDRNEAGS